MTNTSLMTPKPFVFVLMPFASEFRDIYHLGIKAACSEVGTYCERVDEQNFDGTIIDRIYNQIAKADIIISDMTGKNPNVFYETGYAHALGKRVILLTQREEDIPFDLKHYPHVVYGKSILSLKDELLNKIRWAIENAQKPAIDPLNILGFRLQGKAILPNTDFIVTVGLTNDPFALVNSTSISHTTEFKIDIHNESNRIINASTFQMGIVIPSSLHLSSASRNIIHLGENQRMIIFDKFESFLPNSWQSVSIHFANKVLQIRSEVWHLFGLRLFSEVEMKEIPFKVRFSINNVPATKR